MSCSRVGVYLCFLWLCGLVNQTVTRQLSEKEVSLSSFQVKSLNSREAAICAALRKTSRLDYFETRFEDVISEISDDYRIQVMLHESAADNNLDADTLITGRYEDIPLADSLQQILAPFDVTISIQNEILRIVSRDHARLHPEIRLYECSKLFSQSGAEHADQWMEDLVGKVQAGVSPDSWQINGGSSSISYFHGVLVINQTLTNHQEIEALLKKLDRALEDR